MKKTRLQNVIRNMEQAGLNQIVVSDPLSIYYLTGISIHPGERLFALLIKSDGSAVLFNNRLFPLEEQTGLRIVYHSDGEDAVSGMADMVSDGPIGIDKLWPSKFLLELVDKRGGLKPKAGSGPVDSARMVKDEEEIELMRAASRVNDTVMEEALRQIDGVKTEKQFAGIVSDLYMRHGADSAPGQLVCYGAGCSEPHHDSGSAKLQKGESVILDIFAPVRHYWCDMTRTVFFGSVSDEQKRVYETVKAANLAGIAAIRPGLPLKDFDRAARKVIEDAGYGKFFTHRLGHGIGLDVHEPPDCSAVSDTIAKPGMCFSVEPGVYLPGRFGVRVEDLIVVTEDGAEVLNAYSKDLKII